MIPPEQLAGALARLDPRERELLALSLRRRVPDAAGDRRGPGLAFLLGSFTAAVIGGAAAFVALSEWGGGGGGTDTAAAAPRDEGTKHFVPELGGPFEAPFPSEPQPISC